MKRFNDADQMDLLLATADSRTVDNVLIMSQKEHESNLRTIRRIKVREEEMGDNQ